MQKLINNIKRTFASALAAVMVLPCTAIIGGGIFGATTLSTAPEADAQRGRGRSTTVARSTPRGTTVRHTSTRRAPAAGRGPASPAGVARRTTRRVARRRMYTLPTGYRMVTWNTHRYYYYSGLYYYPYYISGRTVYIEIDIDASGNPEAPLPAADINAGY